MFTELINSDRLPSSQSTPVDICQNEQSCLKPALFPCHHCVLRLCLGHIIEHNNRNVYRSIELLNDLNDLSKGLTSRNVESSYEEVRHRMDKWKDETIKHVEIVHRQLCEKIDQQKNELNIRWDELKKSLQTDATIMEAKLQSFLDRKEISQQQIRAVEESLRSFRQCVDSLQCQLNVETRKPALDHCIEVHQNFSYNRNYSFQEPLRPYQTLSVTNLKRFVSSPEYQTILWYDEQYQLFHMDRNGQTDLLFVPHIQNQPISLPVNKRIMDMKWSSYAKRFFILFKHFLYAFEPKTKEWMKISLPQHYTLPFHCLCLSNDSSSLYISYHTMGICVDRWKYSWDINNNESMILPEKTWRKDDRRKSVEAMSTNSIGQIGLIIRQRRLSQTHFQLCDQHLNELRKIELPDSDIHSIYASGHNNWFLTDSSHKSYIYSTEKNEYEQLPDEFPYGLQEFGTNSIVIAKTVNQIMICDV